MTIHVADFAPDQLPDIQYTRINEEQATHIRAAMELPENQERFDVTFLPIDTPEQRQAAAEEWAAYLQAKGDAKTKAAGAILVMSTRDETPEALRELLEDQDHVPGGPFATHALWKVVKKQPGAQTFDLLQTYYDSKP